MVDQEAVEEGRVAVLQRGQADVLLERVLLARDVLPLELDLLLDGLDAVGQHAAQPEGLALVLAEGEVLGEEAGAQQLEATQVDLGRPTGDDGREWLLEWLHPDLRDRRTDAAVHGRGVGAVLASERRSVPERPFGLCVPRVPTGRSRR